MNVSQDNRLTGAVIGAAIHVHQQLGPDLSETAYEEALAQRLSALRIPNRRQVPLPLCYKGVKLDCGYRLDLLIDERLPLELKAVEHLLPVHEAQLLTQLRVGRFPLGLLINFNVALLKEGIRRRVETREWQSVAPNETEFHGFKLFDSVSAKVVMAAIEVHRQLGPGMLASAYEECLCFELAGSDLAFERKKEIPLSLDEGTLSTPAQIPLLVGATLPVFSFCVDDLTDRHTATLLARLRQGGWKHGLLLNFNARIMVEGIKRIVL